MKHGLILLIFIAVIGLAFAKNMTVSYNFPSNSGIADVKEAISINDDANAFSAFIQTAQAKSLTLDISYYDFDGDGIG